MSASIALEPNKAKALSGTEVDIPLRRMDFDFSESPHYAYNNDSYMTTSWAAFSALFPEGESFFAESVRHYRNRITDPVLKDQIKNQR